MKNLNYITAIFKTFFLILITSFLVACDGGGNNEDTNSAPTASNVNITGGNGDSGDALPGDSLTGSYSYSDADNNSEATSTFRWLRDGTAISGETSSTYTVTYADKDTSISFEVTPVSSVATGSAMASSNKSARLAIFDTFQNADVVFGQADFTGQYRNQGINKSGTVNANTLSGTTGNPSIHNGVLYVTDTGNNRLLGFNSIPSVNNTHADFVLGQPDFTTNTAGTSSLIFNSPVSVATDNGKMFISDPSNERVLIWNSTPTSGNHAADIALGASDLDTVDPVVCDSSGFYTPEGGVWATDGKLLVVDAYHNRVLIWNTIPSTNNTPADLVLGQKTFTTCKINDDDGDGVTDGPTARTLNEPAGVWSDGTRVAVNDWSNNRVLIWNTFPTSNQQPADVVIGQGGFDQSTINDDNQDSVDDGTSTARTLNSPSFGIHSNGTQLFVTDRNNSRVLIWNSFPTTNFQNADVVIGQSDFTHSDANDDDQAGGADASPTARTLSNPAGVFQSGRYLVISDSGNHRVLIYYGH